MTPSASKSTAWMGGTAVSWRRPPETATRQCEPNLRAGREVRLSAASGILAEMSELPGVSLQLATLADQPLLANLLELYVHDLSAAFPNVEMGADGRFGYP